MSEMEEAREELLHILAEYDCILKFDTTRGVYIMNTHTLEKVTI